MSASSEKISNVVVGSDEDGDEEDEYDGAAIGKKQRTRTRTGCGTGKAKQVVLHQFAIAKMQLHRIRSKSKRALVPSSSSHNANASVSGKNKMIIRGDDTGTNRSGCKFCFSRPKVLESPNESPTSDPNDPNFTHAMLRTLIEKNDFYSKECNPHLD